MKYFKVFELAKYYNPEAAHDTKVYLRSRFETIRAEINPLIRQLDFYDKGEFPEFYQALSFRNTNSEDFTYTIVSYDVNTIKYQLNLEFKGQISLKNVMIVSGDYEQLEFLINQKIKREIIISEYPSSIDPKELLKELLKDIKSYFNKVKDKRYLTEMAKFNDQDHLFDILDYFKDHPNIKNKIKNIFQPSKATKDVVFHDKHIERGNPMMSNYFSFFKFNTDHFNSFVRLELVGGIISLKYEKIAKIDHSYIEAFDIGEYPLNRSVENIWKDIVEDLEKFFKDFKN